MKPIETVQRVHDHLATCGVTNGNPTPKQVWEAFKLFARDPVECQDDFMLVQVGDSAVMGDSYLDFCREFRLIDADGDAWSEQVHAEFKTVLPTKLGHKQTDCASYDYESLDDFFRAVEEMPEFQAGLAFDGWDFSVYHTGV